MGAAPLEHSSVVFPQRAGELVREDVEVGLPPDLGVPDAEQLREPRIDVGVPPFAVLDVHDRRGVPEDVREPPGPLLHLALEFPGVPRQLLLGLPQRFLGRLPPHDVVARPPVEEEDGEADQEAEGQDDRARDAEQRGGNLPRDGLEVVQIDHAPAGVRRDVLPVEPVRPTARVPRRAVAQDRKAAPFPRPRSELLGPRHLLDVLLGQALQRAVEPLLPAGGEDDPLRVQEENDPLAPLAELPLDRRRGDLDHRDADGRGGRIPVHRVAEVDAADVRRHPLRHVGGGRSPDRLLPVRPEGEIVPDEAVRRVPVAGRDRHPVPVHDVADVGREGVPEVVEDGVRPREGRSPGMGQDLPHLLHAGEGAGRLQVLGEERGDPVPDPLRLEGAVLLRLLVGGVLEGTEVDVPRDGNGEKGEERQDHEDDAELHAGHGSIDIAGWLY